MPVNPPINISELAKKGILDENRFFKLLSESNNYVDERTVRDFYMGLIRMMTKEIRTNGIVRLPHIGDFALVKTKPRMGWIGKTMGMVPEMSVLKFYANNSWRKYFTTLQNNNPNRKMDPREKVLDKKL